MSSPLVAPPVAKTKSLSCPNCGGPVELRGFGRALSVVCPQCLSVLDASTPELKIIQEVQSKQRVTPKIPLGTRGKFGGVAWEAIGFQCRTVYEDGEAFSWYEYLLFNPYKGFRYISEYDGHWNYIVPLEPQPVRIALARRPGVQFEGRTYKHFSGAEAATTFVLGEFPWRVNVGEKVICDDFVDPPTVLSSETTADEITWSRGEYTPGVEIWKAFALPGSPPPARGVYLNQPSPYGKGGMWGNFGWLLAMLILLAIFFAIFSRGNIVFQESYRFSTADKGEPSLVTPVFNLEGRTAALELKVHTNLSNNWAYFNFALINQDTGTAYDFGREVSSYSGSDSDGAWSEGGDTSTVYIPSVPPGHYYLRIEPEMDATAGRFQIKSNTRINNMVYDVTLRHDVMNSVWIWIAAALLLIPPVFHSIRARSFEASRWVQSDYPPVIRSSGGS
jgi:hypothetical protein